MQCHCSDHVGIQEHEDVPELRRGQEVHLMKVGPIDIISNASIESQNSVETGMHLVCSHAFHCKEDRSHPPKGPDFLKELRQTLTLACIV